MLLSVFAYLELDRLITAYLSLLESMTFKIPLVMYTLTFWSMTIEGIWTRTSLSIFQVMSF